MTSLSLAAGFCYKQIKCVLLATTAMSDIGRHTHWENVYQTKAEREVSWFEENPAVSLELIHATGVTAAASIVDIGGGASRLVDALLDASCGFVTVLDVSEHALAVAQARLGSRSAMAKWIAADVTAWRPSETYDVWHDRAAFHFLTDDRDRAAYAERVAQAVRRGGHVIIGTFAPDGPERCSGLLVLRHDAASLGAVLGSSFSLVESRNYTHPTPMGTSQRFQFSRFRYLN